ncbi:hypothetical protein ACVR05_08010 [Streptococcus caprae]|uniref:DUF2568 domain-containing protein n=1 Tax=Streptococcus caprae TaxID=1640501 RepID=A0ABV8CSZ8_9STRE
MKENVRNHLLWYGLFQLLTAVTGLFFIFSTDFLPVMWVTLLLFIWLVVTSFKGRKLIETNQPVSLLPYWIYLGVQIIETVLVLVQGFSGGFLSAAFRICWTVWIIYRLKIVNQGISESNEEKSITNE